MLRYQARRGIAVNAVCRPERFYSANAPGHASCHTGTYAVPSLHNRYARQREVPHSGEIAEFVGQTSWASVNPSFRIQPAQTSSHFGRSQAWSNYRLSPNSPRM